ncbi:MAG: SGNH/GDSL hydrolase family protein [Okeania sp. SIO3B5]|uniref:SGNH/GDSL hydrolase family protein n=1 Tax=Okeania sp. SIO3B5 TaxID=2607811 RepID=UPI0013FF8854|nr:SGNH/GDSL hydrolase family protein [Okeania sp. SIO3B5]NEO55223.1 SGNH/GDSL hydrolase family protein [Okeania sp. SIO3B5]
MQIFGSYYIEQGAKMNHVFSISIALSTSALTMGIFPVSAANINSDNSNLDFSQMFIFGDSLSDTGNSFSQTGGVFPGNPLSFEGRFSNRPIWIESLASSLNLNPTAFFTNFSVSPDGANYATGGSLSGDQNILDDFPLGLQQQLESFITPLLATDNSANSEALYTIWTGANDYLLDPLFTLGFTPQPDAPPNTDTTINNISNAIASLYNIGARNFLIPNLPSLGISPLATLTNTSNILNELTDEHNQKLEDAIAELNQSLVGAKIILLDVNSIVDEIFENPSQFNVTNTTDSWSDTVLAFCPDAFLGADGSVESCDIDVPDSDEYLFWDIVHPTEVSNQIVADKALSALKSEFQTVPEPTSTLSFVGIGASLFAMSAFKQKYSAVRRQQATAHLATGEIKKGLV